MSTIKINGGDKAKSFLKAIADKLRDNPKLRVGFLENAKYPDGTSVAAVAAYQDFGTDRIPPRPFFRNMVAAKEHEWGPALGNLMISTNYDADKSLRTLGLGIKGQLQQSIRDTNEPPLSPRTIKAKGFAKPLIDTGHMINSVDFEVTK